MTKALIVEPSGKTHLTEIETDLANLQAIVGGYIEHVAVPGAPEAHAYCNEEGKFMADLAPNPFATQLLGLTGLDVVMGTVVFLGSTGDGDEADVPTWMEVYA